MSDYLAGIVQPTGAYAATYVKAEIASKPATGCDIPPAPDITLSLPDITQPPSSKLCVPLFVQFPVIPEPFALPENCANGLTFNVTDVGILASPNASSPIATIPVSITQSSADFCTYDLNIPDIVIPCFPTGPRIGGSANITVVDLNAGQTTNNQITINQNQDVACLWALDGDMTITLPKIPCPAGISFGATQLIVNDTSGGQFLPGLVTIINDISNSCKFDISMPELTIPCYPDGPKVTGGINFTLTDQSNPVYTTTAPIVTNPANACQFNLGGDITVDIPCSTSGMNRNPQVVPWTIQTKDLTTSPPTYNVATVLDIVTERADDNICNIRTTIPPLTIPCYPDGPIFTSHLIVTTLDDSQPASDIVFLDSGNCNIGLQGVVKLPVMSCAGFEFNNDSGFNVMLNNSAPIARVSQSGPNTYIRYNSLALKPINEGCGATLSGVLNLGLPNFVTNCTSLTAGPGVIVKYLGDSTGASDKTLALEANTCGFGFNLNELDIPGCLNYKSGVSTIKVTDANNNIVPHNIQLTDTGCGVTLSGTLQLPIQPGSQGLGAIKPFSKDTDYNYGDLAYYVYPLGGRSIHRYNRPASGRGGMNPSAPSASTTWDTVGRDGPPVFEPFNIKQCNEWTPALVTSIGGKNNKGTFKQKLVKVVPNSMLYRSSVGTNNLIPIYGLNQPFILGPNQWVWLEITIDPTQTPYDVVSAAIATGLSWDETVGTVIGVASDLTTQADDFKRLKPSDAGILYSSTYVQSELTKYVGLSTAQTNSLLTKHQSALANIMASSGSQPLQFKYYALIAKSGQLEDAEEASNSGDLTLSQGAVAQALATATLTAGFVSTITITNPGNYYQSAPNVIIANKDNTKDPATAVAVIDPELGMVTSINITHTGSGYTTAPVISLADGGASQAYTYVVHQYLTKDQILKGYNYNNTPCLRAEDYSGKPGSADQLPVPSCTAYAQTLTFDFDGGFYTATNSGFTIRMDDSTFGAVTAQDGTLILTAQVYYTTDGSPPTTNTGANPNCFKYDPTNPPTFQLDPTTQGSDTTDGITWFAYCPIFKLPSKTGFISYSEILANATIPQA